MKSTELKNLTKEQKENLIKRVEEKLNEFNNSPALYKSNDLYTPFKLTDIQSSYFVGKQIENIGCHTYLEFTVYNIDIERLENAWNTLIEFHPMLRAKVTSSGKQIIQEKVDNYHFSIYNWAEEADQIKGQRKLRKEMSHKVYAFDTWPLFDIRVSSIERKSTVHVSMDSWIVDGTSAAIIYEQWYKLYHYENYSLKPLEVNFHDYIISMEKFKNSNSYQKCIDYWTNKLTPFPDSPNLPIEKGARNNKRSRLIWESSSEQWMNFKGMLKNYTLNPTSALLTIFSDYISEYCSQDEFAILMTYANRPQIHSTINEVVGPFTTSGVVKISRNNKDTLLTRISKNQKQIFRDLDYLYVSGLSALKNQSKDSANKALPIVFTSMLNQGETEDTWLNTVEYSVSQTPQIYLECQLQVFKGKLRVIWDYAEGYLQTDEIKSLFDYYTKTIQTLSNKDYLINERSISKYVFQENKKNILKNAHVRNDVSLTNLQQSYISQRLLNPKTGSSLVYKSFEIRELNISKFETLLNNLINNRESLRYFANKNGKVGELKDNKYSIVVKDFTGLTNGQIEIETHRLIEKLEQDLVSQFDSQRFAVAISRATNSTYRIHIMLDMVWFDGFSTWLFYDYLFLSYFKKEIPYTSENKVLRYLNARKEYEQTDQYKYDYSYWNKKFSKIAGGPKLVNHGKAVEGNKTNFYYTIKKQKRLLDIATELEISPISIIIAVFMEVLYKWNEKKDFTLLLADYENRNLLHEKYDFGDYTNLSWIEYGKSRESFKDKLYNVQNQINLDSQHSWGNPLKSLFNTMQNRNEKIEFPIVVTNCIESSTSFLKYVDVFEAYSNTPDIGIDNVVYKKPNGISFHWEVNENIIPSEIAGSLFSEYCDAIESFMDRSKWEIDFEMHDRKEEKKLNFELTEEQQRIIYEWNNTDKPYQSSLLIHQLFEQQVQTEPHNIAIITDHTQLSYLELNKRSNQLANYLKQKGVGKGDLVGIYLDRSEKVIISLLAVLKAGATYVPINHDDPIKRIENVINTSRLKYIISNSSLFHEMSTMNIEKIVVDKEETAISMHGVDNLNENISSDSLAYVIFTSGSTGMPKGVAVKHKPVINLIEWAQKTFHFTKEDRLLFVNPIGFDLSVFDIFGLLAYGGSVRVVSDKDKHNASRLLDLLSTEKITFWNSAPAYLQMLVPFIDLKEITNWNYLRLVFLSGDWIPLSLPDAIRNTFKNAEIISLGGATEATVWSNYFRVEEINQEWKSIPYGKPIQNARYYILDEKLKPCGIGQTGELYIGGSCLSEGYYNNKLETMKSFVKDIYHEEENMIMYKTGDLARYYEDGNIEFLGRSDHQVKIRGYRIELGEIEKALYQAGFNNIVVIVKNDSNKNKYIVAFGEHPSFKGLLKDEEIIEQLEKLLPKYMYPSQVVSLTGIPTTNNGKVDRKYLINNSVEEIIKNDSAILGVTQKVPSDEQEIKTIILQEIATILDKNIEEIDLTTNIGELGFNSLQYTILSAKIVERYHVEINPALFFRYNTGQEIANFLLENYSDKLMSVSHNPSTDHTKYTSDYGFPQQDHQHNNPTTDDYNDKDTLHSEQDDIAIIGLHTVMPQSDDTNEFWTNLINGMDTTETIPKERWNWEDYYGDPTNKGNYSNVKYASFMNNVDKFDAKFFGISPREAELMDPRQRKLLEGTWKTIEDAGYKPSMLRGRSVGVFIGATGDEYGTMALNSDIPIDQYSLMGGSRTILTNRINYVFDWNGPSEVVDTACSSSLVSVHRAVNAIKSGECEIAIAGGVNIIIDPTPHISLNKVGMLSSDGKCKTFDASANGYGRGEGLGLLLLKPLEQAKKDGDHIYSVIKGSAINHGGKANALTAPNPKAQADVIVSALRDSNVSPAQVGFIETHGTGTSLGDPIEIEGLKEAYSRYSEEYGQGSVKQDHAIGLGAVKTNIGHLESAAGIAGLIKLILSIYYKTLPPNIHQDYMNPNIDIVNSPYYLVNKLEEWKKPSDQYGNPLPRVGGISSFGFGGVNAHIIVEEYTNNNVSRVDRNSPVIIPLSAKNNKVLLEYAKSLLTFIQKSDKPTIHELAYTLQGGREEFDDRLAVVVYNYDELHQKLTGFINGFLDIDNLYYGNRNSSKVDVMHLENDKEAITSIIKEKKYEKVAWLWTWGISIEWDILNDGEELSKSCVPTYPFANTSYWLTNINGFSQRYLPEVLDVDKKGTSVVTIDGEEKVLRDHQINGTKVLPAAAYLELIRASTNNNMEAFQVENVIWLRSIVEEHIPKEYFIRLKNQYDDKVAVTIQDSAGMDYCLAELRNSKNDRKIQEMNIKEIQQRMDYIKTDCYELFHELGINYGNGFEVIHNIRYSQTEALAFLSIPNHLIGSTYKYTMHPSILDGALQSALLLQTLTDNISGTYIPFSAEKITCYKRIPELCYVYVSVQKKNNRYKKHDIYILDTDGEIVVEIIGCMARLQQNNRQVLENTSNLDNSTTMYVKNSWKEVQLSNLKEPVNNHYLLIGVPYSVADTLMDNDRRVYKISTVRQEFRDISHNKTEMDINNPVYWRQLLQKFKDIQFSPTIIICWIDKVTVDLNESKNPISIFEQVFTMTKEILKFKKSKRTSFIVMSQQNGFEEINPFIAGTGGFGKSLQKENPKINFKTLLLKNYQKQNEEQINIESIFNIVNLNKPENEFLYDYKVNKLYKNSLITMKNNGTGLPIQERKVYVITGGSGKIGLQIAQVLLDRNAYVALIGRSKLDNQMLENIDTSKLTYYRADVGNKHEIEKAILQIKNDFGSISGIFHCAGSVNDGLLVTKSKQKALETLKSKVEGVRNLDQVTVNEKLDFFVLFSSLTSITGNVGQTDYAYANCFLDYFSYVRNNQAEKRMRHGKTISISWPLWESGGMTLPDDELDYIKENYGLIPITTEEAMRVLFRQLDISLPHIAICLGEKHKVLEYLNINVEQQSNLSEELVFN